MKNLLFILAIISLIACNNNESCHDETIQTPDELEFVSDEIFLQNKEIIDSLKTVEELLNHLETLPNE